MIVVMVAVLRVDNLQAGLPLGLLAVGRVRLDGTRRTLLKEVRHQVHLRRRGKELAAPDWQHESQVRGGERGPGVEKRDDVCCSRRSC